MIQKDGIENDGSENKQKNKVKNKNPPKETNKRRKYLEKETEVQSEYEAPDGGYGWVVAVGLIVVYVREIY